LGVGSENGFLYGNIAWMEKRLNMSRNFLYGIERIYLKPSSIYHAYFHERALILRTVYEKGQLNPKKNSKIPQNLLASEKFQQFIKAQYPVLRENFIDILQSPNSAQILWSLYCSPSPGYHSVLTQLIPSLEAIAYIARGGPNLYKLFGWVVHVLIGYTFIAEYIPEGKLPLFFDWPDQAKVFINDTLKQVYNSLSRIDKLILHTAMLGHDIGVANNITNHDILGVPLVPSFLTQLGFKEENWLLLTTDISFQDLIWAIQVTIQFHTFINRAGVEYSISRSAKELAEILSTVKEDDWRLTFIQKNFAKFLLLVGTSDLVAVNDEMLTERKILGLKKGFELINTLINTKIELKDLEENGFDRFTAFLDDKKCKVPKVDLDEYLSLHGYSPSLFWEKFFLVQEFNFALSLVQYLPTIIDTLIVFLVIFEFIDECLGDIIKYDTVCVVFDHRLTPKFLDEQLLESNDVQFILGSMVTKSKNFWAIGELEFIFKVDSNQSIILINNANGEK
jgi:hypothetical protein